MGRFLDAGDPRGEVRMAWHAKETLRGFWAQPAGTASGYLAEEPDSLTRTGAHPTSVG